MLTVLEGFYYQVARKIAIKTDWCAGDDGWKWPPVEKALEVTGMCTIKEYIQRRQATIEVHITNCPIYEVCTGRKYVVIHQIHEVVRSISGAGGRVTRIII